MELVVAHGVPIIELLNAVHVSATSALLMSVAFGRGEISVVAVGLRHTWNTCQT